MRCVSPIQILIDGTYVTVPCKQCFACRVNHTQEWAFRNALECSGAERAAFITLTYDEDNLQSKSLVYTDLQTFWKNLRRLYDNKIRYFACGEYGEEGGESKFGFIKRPHFHAIVYGIGHDKKDRENVYRAWHKCNPERLLMGNGVAPVTIDDIRYVSGYTEKKLTGALGKQEYQDKGLLPPRSFSSRNPAIGEEQFLSNIDNIREYGCIFWNGQQIPVPEHFKRKYKDLLDNPKLKYEQRKKMLEELEWQDLTPPQIARLAYRGVLQFSYSNKLNEDADARIKRHNILVAQRNAHRRQNESICTL